MAAAPYEAMLERLLELGKPVLVESDLDRILTAAVDGVIELCGAARASRRDGWTSSIRSGLFS